MTAITGATLIVIASCVLQWYGDLIGVAMLIVPAACLRAGEGLSVSRPASMCTVGEQELPDFLNTEVGQECGLPIDARMSNG